MVWPWAALSLLQFSWWECLSPTSWIMESENATVDGNFTKGYAMEVVFSHHSTALFAVILGSLILGLPLAWNMLWHLKESAFQYDPLDLRYVIFLIYTSQLVEWLQFCFSDSVWCKWKRCTATPLNSATDKFIMHSSHLPAVLHSCISICMSATISLLNVGSSIIGSFNKWHNRSHNHCIGKVQSRKVWQC